MGLIYNAGVTMKFTIHWTGETLDVMVMMALSVRYDQLYHNSF